MKANKYTALLIEDIEKNIIKTINVAQNKKFYNIDEIIDSLPNTFADNHILQEAFFQYEVLKNKFLNTGLLDQNDILKLKNQFEIIIDNLLANTTKQSYLYSLINPALDKSIPNIARKPFTNYENLCHLRGIINNINKENGQIILTLQTISTDGLSIDVIIVHLFDHSSNNLLYPNLTKYETILATGQDIFIQNCTFYKGNEYYSTADTLIVLYPDYIIDVRDVSDVHIFNNSYPHFIKLVPIYSIIRTFVNIDNPQKIQSILIGNLLGEIFDVYIANDKVSEDNLLSAYKDFIGKNIFELLFWYNNSERVNIDFLIEIIKKEYLSGLELMLPSIKRDKSSILYLEPFYISHIYGLQGRMDALAFTEKGNSANIYELKSHKPKHKSYLYTKSHDAQLICYYLLFRSTYPDKKLFYKMAYPGAEEHHLRSITFGDNAEERQLMLIQEVLFARNNIVKNHIDYANGDFSSLIDCLPKNSDESKPMTFSIFSKNETKLSESQTFMYNDIDLLHKSINKIANNKLLNAYFWGYVRFIYRELLTAKLGNPDLNDAWESLINESQWGYANIWKKSINKKFNQFEILGPLTFKSFTDDNHLIFSIDNENISISRLREDDIIILYPYNTNAYNPLNQQLLKGYIVRIDNHEVELSIANKYIPQKIFTNKSKWVAEADRWFHNYNYGIRNLYYLISNEDEQFTDLFLGIQKPAFSEDYHEINKLDGLDSSQEIAVEQALKAKNYFLIQGPPGTGKTAKTLTAIAKNLFINDDKTLIVAYTRRAVDEICFNLDKHSIPYILLNKDLVKNQLLSAKDIDHLNNILPELDNLLNGNKIFVATLSFINSHISVVDAINPNTLIVDEATQILEYELVAVLSKTKRWILIGDENQLPAVVLQKNKSQKADLFFDCQYTDYNRCPLADNGDNCTNNLNGKCVAMDILKQIHLDDFSEPLFTRLKKNAINKGWDECYCMLKYHHRMHEDIAKYVNELFYDKKLMSATERQKSPLSQAFYLPSSIDHSIEHKYRVMFISTPIDEDSFFSPSNKYEAQIVIELIKSLKSQFPDYSIGVITPYRSQIALIKSMLSPDFADITIDTVERYQGSERDIIIYSFAINNMEYLELSQSMNAENSVDRKLNVSLTRAKELLFLVGNTDILSSHPFINHIIKDLQNKGAVITINS
jgi:DNA replication ATP-dependent helicase Dna2